MPASVLHLQAEMEDTESKVAHTLKASENHQGMLSIINTTPYSHICHGKGYLECMNDLRKQLLNKMLGRAFISLKHLETIIVENALMLNNRLLTYVCVS